MKVKRIISALAALAMSVSCLAGLTITVNAEIPSNTIDENFEGVVSEDWTKHDGAFNTSNSGAYGADPAVATESENSNKYLKWSCTGKNDRNGRGMYIGLPSTPIDKQYQLVKFDFAYNTWWANNATQDGMYLLDSNGKKIVSLNFEGAKATSETDNAVNTNSSITVNSGETKDVEGYNAYQNGGLDTKKVWYTFEGKINFDAKKVTYKIYATASGDSGAQSKTVDFIESDAVNVARFATWVNSNCVFCVDNFQLRELETPVINISDDALNQTIEDKSSGTATVACTVSNVKEEDGVTVESSAAGVATAEWKSDQNQILITAKGQDGVADITVKAVSNDDVEITKIIHVTVGAVAKHKVTIKYLVKDSESETVKAADETTYAEVTEGSKISSIPYDETVISEDTNTKYVYDSMVPEVSEENQYTVPKEDSEIKVLYTKHAKVTNIVTEYKAGDDIVASETTNLDGDKYDGDALSETIYSSRYVVKDNKLYKRDSASSLVANTVPVGGKCSVAVTADTSNYKAVQFVEAEDVTGIKYAYGNNNNENPQADNLSKAYGTRELKDGVEMLTVAESGVYTVSTKAFSKNQADGSTLTLYKNEQKPENKILEVGAAVSYRAATDTTEANVKLAKNDKIIAVGTATDDAQSGNVAMDYLLIGKTAEYEPESKDVAEDPTVLGSITKPDGVTDELDTYAAEMKVKTISIVIPDTEAEIPKLSVQNYNGGEEFDPGWVAVTSGGSRIFYVQFRAADFSALGTVKATYGGKDIAISLADGE